MSCPKRITVAGRPWRIRFVGQPKMIRLAEGDTNCLGLTFGSLLNIYVADWLPTFMQQEIVLHEVMHACVYGGQFAGNVSDDTDHEEHYVSGIDAPLLTTLRENPELVAYLTA